MTIAILKAAAGAGGGAPVNAPYVTMALVAGLPNERVLAAGVGIGLIDGGAGGNATLSIAAHDHTTAAQGDATKAEVFAWLGW